MNTSPSQIQKRQQFYFLGKKHEDEGNFLDAIEAYKIYSTHLEESDKHIPHQWIFEFYEKLGELENPYSTLKNLQKDVRLQEPPKYTKSLVKSICQSILLRKLLPVLKMQLKTIRVLE